MIASPVGKTVPITKIVVIGLGLMGLEISRHLHKAGFFVVGYDVDAARVELACAIGLTAYDRFDGLPEDVALVFTSLPSDAALDATVSAMVGTSGLSLKDMTVIELSTLSSACKLRNRDLLKVHGATLLDCPISGTAAQAQSADTVVYASGDRDRVERARPAIDTFCRECIYVGPFGDGMRCKLIANLLVAIHNVAAAEALALAARAGVDTDMALRLLQSGAGNSRILELRGPMMVSQIYEPPTMKLSVWEKDLKLIREFADSVGAKTPLFSATLPVYDATIRLGGGQQDTAAVHQSLLT